MFTPEKTNGIVIPFYNRWDLTNARLNELMIHIKEPCIILLVDDASTENVEHKAYWWKMHSMQHTIDYARKNKNTGFGDSMNYGAKMILDFYECENLILLSNDVKISGDFIAQTERLLGKYDRALVCGEIIGFPAGWNEFEYDNKRFYIPYANGWFLAMNVETWKLLGGFDTSYGKYDYEDIDLSVRAILHGIQIVPLNTPYLYHIGGQQLAVFVPTE